MVGMGKAAGDMFGEYIPLVPSIPVCAHWCLLEWGFGRWWKQERAEVVAPNVCIKHVERVMVGRLP